MKILKIRENKLKLSLSCEEAAVYGLSSHGQSPRDLRAAVERIFADRRELFRIEEKIIVEAYPKIDGSCDVFVTNLAPSGADSSDGVRRVSTWGFSSLNHLAQALQVLLCERERVGAMGLCERSSLPCEACANELCTAENSKPLSLFYTTDAFCIEDLRQILREKTENDPRQRLDEALCGARIYKNARDVGSDECAYVLVVNEREEDAERFNPLYEMATPVAQLSAEVLEEHAVALSLDELLG